MPGESHEQRILAGYSPWGRKELDTTEATEHNSPEALGVTLDVIHTRKTASIGIIVKNNYLGETVFTAVKTDTTYSLKPLFGL